MNGHIKLTLQQSLHQFEFSRVTSMAHKQLPCAKSCLLDSEIHCSCSQFALRYCNMSAMPAFRSKSTFWPPFRFKLVGMLSFGNILVVIERFFIMLLSLRFFGLETPRSWRGTSMSSQKLPSLSWQILFIAIFGLNKIILIACNPQ